MEEEFKYLYDLLEQKKQKVLTEEDQEKVNQVESLLKIQGIFFKLNLDTAIGILNFLEIPKESIKEMYIKLTSPEAYKKTAIKEYNSIELPPTL